MATRKATGRPPIPVEARKHHRLQVMFRGSEFAAVERAAGTVPLSVWAHDILLGAAHAERKPSVAPAKSKDVRDLREALRGR